MHPALDSGILARLRAIVGDRHVVTADDDKEPYSHDETLNLKAMPAVVVRPGSTAEVAAIMKLASSERTPVTPRGAGTGLSGGALAVRGGILLSLERLDKILEIDAENLMVVTQPAVITNALQLAAEAQGLFYPPDPASLESCSIGGNVAENAGGPRAFKYGVTRHYLCGLEVVWPGGEVSRLGGKTIKNVSGYDLMHLLCGSEGTLAVVTEITLRLLPRPAHAVDLMVPFPSIDDAVRACTAVIRARIVPATMEFMERSAVLAAERFLGKQAPFRDAEAHLLMQLDGDDPAALAAQYERIGAIVSGYGALDVLVAEDRPSRDRIWETRRCMADALTAMSPVREREDVVVPRAAIPELFRRLRALSQARGAAIISYGHIGDGNVHVNIMRQDMAAAAWEGMLPALLDGLFRDVVALGGTISGEHGIGCVKRRFLPLAVDPAALEMMRRIKAAHDPHGILNPGKILP